MKTNNFLKRSGIWALALVLVGGVLAPAALADSSTEEPENIITLPVENILPDHAPEDEDTPFVFEITPLDDDYPVPADLELTIEGEGTGEFEPIEFNRPGIYQYEVRQIDLEHENYAIDESVYEVYVTVKNDEHGDLQAVAQAVREGDEDAEKMAVLLFEPDYLVEEEPNEEATPTPAPTPTPTASTVKTVLGGSPKTGDSTDILTPVVLLSVFVLALAIVVVYHKKKGER